MLGPFQSDVDDLGARPFDRAGDPRAAKNLLGRVVFDCLGRSLGTVPSKSIDKTDLDGFPELFADRCGSVDDPMARRLRGARLLRAEFGSDAVDGSW